MGDKLDARCKCNNGIDSFWVSPEAHYPLWSFFAGLLLGVAPSLPDRIRWRCRTCGTVIAESRDEALRVQHQEM